MSDINNSDFVPDTDEPEDVREMKLDLAKVFNKYGFDNASGTPDFILADIAYAAVLAFSVAVQDRATWRGETVEFNPLGYLDGTEMELNDRDR